MPDGINPSSFRCVRKAIIAIYLQRAVPCQLKQGTRLAQGGIVAYTAATMLPTALPPSLNQRAALSRFVALVCVICVYMFGINSLKSDPVSFDEIETLKHTITRWAEYTYTIPETINSVSERSVEHGPLYFVVLNIWQRLAGYDLFSSRLLSVFFAMLVVVAVYRLAALTRDREIACAAAIAIAGLAYFNYYAHVTRFYALLLLVVCWLLWSYWRVVSADAPVRGRRWLSLFAATALIVYINYFGFIIIAALGCYHLLFAPKDRRWLFVALTMAAGCLTFIGWLPVALRGFGRSQDVLAETHMAFGEALQAILALSANGLWIIPPIAFAAALAYRRRLTRAEQFLLFVGISLLAMLLLLNEIVPILVEQRMRYITILLLPMCCTIVIGLRYLPGWRRLRWLMVALALASFFAYAGGEDLFRFAGLRHSQADRKTHLQEFIYESQRFAGKGLLILSMDERARWTENGQPVWYRAQLRQRGYTDLAFIGYDDGQLWINSGSNKHATREGIVEHALGTWVIHNPAAVDLNDLAFYRDWFLTQYRSCGVWLQKQKAIIEFYLQHDIPCALVSDDAPAAAIFNNDATLGNYLVEAQDDAVIIWLWWQDWSGGDAAYSLSLVNTAGVELAQVATQIASGPIAVHHLDTLHEPIGDIEVRLRVDKSEVTIYPMAAAG